MLVQPDAISALSDTLARQLHTMGVALNDAQQKQCLDYLALLLKWNAVHNLTAITQPQEMLTKHVLDSLTCVPYLHGQHIVDVGSGGGLPGLLLAIAVPDKQFLLLDSRTKKTQFLSYAVIALGLNNVRVHTGRVEAFQPSTLFDTVVSRAFASLDDMLTLTTHLCAPGGYFLAMKGEVPDGLPDQADVYPQTVPGLTAARHLIRLKKAD